MENLDLKFVYVSFLNFESLKKLILKQMATGNGEKWFTIYQDNDKENQDPRMKSSGEKQKRKTTKRRSVMKGKGKKLRDPLKDVTTQYFFNKLPR